ncbi:hypothetical protein H4R99_001073 [Coemansia sp. RSA 1722]|nr:hypothetical protein IWW45_007377 [Coemansia sp. RSA 485]KAJ2601831.1 hypothetical protein GGF39_001034 [Coemansia sp. RSA 1721]KAJ2605497.1 hypothetical protein H4R99_001073 [Coemansia sp. RSA 1722]KAJ2639162.1 hypothetical protein GGF40_001116 [Coemansia sp. RSA 1286]
MVGLNSAYVSHISDRCVRAQEFELLSIDYAQGESDMNFVFFFSTSRRKRPLPTSRVIDSLFKAVVQFPILLGRVVSPEQSHSGTWKVVVDPDNLNWPDITEASVGGITLASLKRARYSWKRWSRVSKIPDLCERPNLPMFGLHIVRYACGGISLHTKVRHQVMDGNGIWRFYNTWAKICYDASMKPRAQAANKASEAPVHSRFTVHASLDSSSDLLSTEIQAAKSKRLDLENIFLQLVAHKRKANLTELEAPWRVHKFGLSHDALFKLKQTHGNLAQCSAGHTRDFVTKHGISFVSSNDLICAIFWRAISRANAIANPDNPLTCLMLACDVRNRINVPSTYTGNLSFPLIIHMTKDMICQQTVTETATHIRHEINNITPAFVQEMLGLMSCGKTMQNLVSMFDPANSFLSASITSGFRMYEMINFGFGKPAHIDIPAYLKPGFSIWLPTRSNKTAIFINIALRDDVFRIMMNDEEFRTYIDLIH